MIEREKEYGFGTLASDSRVKKCFGTALGSKRQSHSQESSKVVNGCFKRFLFELRLLMLLAVANSVKFSAPVYHSNMALQPSLVAKQVIIVAEQFRRKNIFDNTTESDEEEWDEEIALTSLIIEECELRLIGKGKRPTQIRIQNYAEEIVPSYSVGSFRSHFRVTPSAAEDLENKISSILARQGLVGRHTISPRKQILVVLWLLATPDSYRSIGEQFGMSKATLHHCFRRVINALCGLVKSQIFWPQGREAEIVQEKFYRLSGMPNVIGAIDGCQVEIDAPKEDAVSYKTGKKKYAMQLQAVCTSDLLLIDTFSGYPGSVHDARVFKNSPLYRDAQSIFVGEEYIIGDKAYYPVHTWCIPPYKNYGNLTEAELVFNTKLSKTRQVIERCFCLLKGRFRRLKHLVMYRTDEMALAILAACVLHNLCLRGLHDEPDHIEEYIRDGMESQSQQPSEEYEYAEGSSTVAINKRNRIRDMFRNS